ACRPTAPPAQLRSAHLADADPGARGGQIAGGPEPHGPRYPDAHRPAPARPGLPDHVVDRHGRAVVRQPTLAPAVPAPGGRLVRGVGTRAASGIGLGPDPPGGRDRLRRPAGWRPRGDPRMAPPRRT